MSCNIRCYGVLGDVSIGYPPDTGKLLTCYAPFRRSPAEYCYSPLPRDLHVLSLPLAFILSQDQTLLCIFLYCLALPWHPNSLKELTLSILLFLGTCLYYSFIIVKELIVFPILLANGIAKVRTFSFSPNFFSLFFAFFQKKARNCIIKGVFS